MNDAEKELIASILKSRMAPAFLEDYTDEQLKQVVDSATAHMQSGVSYSEALGGPPPKVDEASSAGRKSEASNIAANIYLAARIAYLLYLSREQYLVKTGLKSDATKELLSKVDRSRYPEIGLVLADIARDIAAHFWP